MASKRKRLDELMREDRDKCLRIAKETPKVQYMASSPHVQKQFDSIGRMWNEFLSITSLGPFECPSSDLLVQFLNVYLHFTEPHIRGKQSISKSTVLKTWATLCKVLRWKYRDFDDKIRRHDHEVVQNFIKQRTQSGQLTRGQYWSKEWLGLGALREITDENLMSCLSHGTRDWDKPLVNTLAFILQYALCARAGDVTRSHLYTGDQFLAYKDIQLTLRRGASTTPNVNDLTARFHLRYRKGEKEESEEGVYTWLHANDDPAHNSICLVKLVLIQAMRIGQTYGSTIENILQHTKNSDSRVRWKYPDRPLICSHSQRTGTLVNEPISVAQLNQNLQDMATQAGLASRVTTHAIRRGALRDLTHLPEPLTIANRLGAAMLAGHSKHAFNSGVTDMYIGGIQTDTFKLRVNNRDWEDEMRPTFGPPNELQRLRPHETTVYMEAKSMQTESPNERAEATRWLRKERSAKRALDAQNDVAEEDDLDFVQGEGTDDGSSDSDSESLDNGDGEAVPTDEGDNQPADNNDQTPRNFGDDEFAMLETFLLGGSSSDATTEDSFSVNIENIILGGRQRSAHNTERPNDSTAALTLPPNEFVTYFASINSVKISATAENFPTPNKTTGDTRSESSQFQFVCKKGECNYSTTISTHFRRHQITCKGKSPNSLVHQCDRCEHEPFGSLVTLNKHIRDEHTDRILYCCDCSDEFQTSKEQLDHFHKVHDLIDGDPIPCPCANDLDPKCSSPRNLWRKWGDIRQHLKLKHRLTSLQMARHLGSRILGRRLGENEHWECPSSTCPRGYVDKSSVRKHLKAEHTMTNGEASMVLAMPIPKVGDPSESMYYCPFARCKYAGRTKELVLGHMRNAHVQPEQVTLGEAAFRPLALRPLAPRHEQPDHVVVTSGQADGFAEQEKDDNDDYGYDGELDGFAEWEEEHDFGYNGEFDEI